jgi:transcriptional regulator with XRE-family HTH domain
VRRDERVKAAFGAAIRKFRVASGHSQEALAELAGIHRTYVGDVERGERNVSIVNMVRLADALDVTLSSIVLEMEKHDG